MSDKITVEFSGYSSVSPNDSRRYAIDHIVDQQQVKCMRGVPLITLRIGFDSITMPRTDFLNHLKACDAAEKGGSEYPEGWKPFYNLRDRP